MNLHWTRTGSGDPLLLLHGLTGVGADWLSVFGDAATGFELLMPDLPGHGQSPRFGSFSFQDASRQVLADLDEMGVAEVPAMGMSGGGQVLLHLATSFPDRIGRTVLVSTAPYFPDSARKLMSVSGPERQSEASWELMRAKHPGGDEQIHALFQAGRDLEHSYRDVNFTPPLLGRIKHRALIVHGDSDPLYGVDVAVALYDAITRSNLWVLPGAGHCPVFDEHAERFRTVSLEFLKRDFL